MILKTAAIHLPPSMGIKKDHPWDGLLGGKLIPRVNPI
jgi:hypothetical protein